MRDPVGLCWLFRVVAHWCGLRSPRGGVRAVAPHGGLLPERDSYASGEVPIARVRESVVWVLLRRVFFLCDLVGSRLLQKASSHLTRDRYVHAADARAHPVHLRRRRLSPARRQILNPKGLSLKPLLDPLDPQTPSLYNLLS